MILIRDPQPMPRTAESPAVSQNVKTATGCRWPRCRFGFRQRFWRESARTTASWVACRDLSQKGSVQASALHQLGRDRCGVDLALERRVEENRSGGAPQRLLDVSRHAHRMP